MFQLSTVHRDYWSTKNFISRGQSQLPDERVFHKIQTNNYNKPWQALCSLISRANLIRTSVVFALNPGRANGPQCCPSLTPHHSLATQRFSPPFNTLRFIIINLCCCREDAAQPGSHTATPADWFGPVTGVVKSKVSQRIGVVTVWKSPNVILGKDLCTVSVE